MTTARTFGTLYQQRASKVAAALFNDLLIYRVCIVVAALDCLDVFDFLEGNNLAKYGYATMLIGFMVAYFVRWKTIDAIFGPLIFLLFFVATGSVFAIRFFFFDVQNSYISSFVSPLIFSIALFIPRNTLVLDARKILRDLTILFSAGTVLYLLEAILRPLVLINAFGLNEVSFIKSMICVLAICLAILMGRKTLALVLASITLVALGLRPTSTLMLGLICCVPIAIALRLRVLRFRPVSLLVGRVLAMGVLILAVSIPLLLYFFFDEIATVIIALESYLKKDIMGGISNTEFRFAILQFAFTTIDNTSLWYGSALSGDITVPLGQLRSWEWWYSQDPNGAAQIHSDFVVILCLTGILGYTLFSGAFYFILRDRFRELLRRDLYGSRVVLQAISVIACVALAIYCSSEPYLAYYSHTNVVWMLLLISEMARKSKVVG